MSAVTRPWATTGTACHRPARAIALWLPDWPVTAATLATDSVGHGSSAPAAVLVGNRVLASNDAARAAGVRRGQRKREAQYRCPSLLLLARDPAIEARLFEPVMLALESVAAEVEITRPGLAAIAARGPVRYYGGEDQALAALARALPETAATPAAGVLLGVADGAFAAGLAARHGTLVPPGDSPAFLAPLPITTLGAREESPLVDVLLRLGIRTLGDFAALPARDVGLRFGPDGAVTHRLSSGRDERPVAARTPPADCSVSVRFEPGLDRSDSVAFSARAAVEDVIARLADRGQACVCVEVQIDTETGEQLTRRWRHTGLLTSSTLVDRIRWQMEALFDPDRARREAGVVTGLRLAPIETVPVGMHQLALWGGTGERDARAERGIARVQSQYGHAAVGRLIVQGGTGPAARSARIQWGEPDEPTVPAAQPWPGHLPAPAPTIVLAPPRPIRVLDAAGQPVQFSDRAAISAAPAQLSIDGQHSVTVTAWAGPWPETDQWWDTSAEPGSRRLRCQLVDALGRAYVATCQPGPEPGWLLEGVYD